MKVGVPDFAFLRTSCYSPAVLILLKGHVLMKNTPNFCIRMRAAGDTGAANHARSAPSDG